MRRTAFLATILVSGALSGCMANQNRQQYMQASAPQQPRDRESICEDVYAATLIAPTMGFADGLSKAMLARSQCLAGQPISALQPAPINQPVQQEQGLHTYMVNGRMFTCNTFGTNTTCN